MDRVMTMDAVRWCGAQGTRRGGLDRAHCEGDLRRGGVDVIRVEAQRGRIG